MNAVEPVMELGEVKEYNDAAPNADMEAPMVDTGISNAYTDEPLEDETQPIVDESGEQQSADMENNYQTTAGNGYFDELMSGLRSYFSLENLKQVWFWIPGFETYKMWNQGWIVRVVSIVMSIVFLVVLSTVVSFILRTIVGKEKFEWNMNCPGDIFWYWTKYIKWGDWFGTSVETNEGKSFTRTNNYDLSYMTQSTTGPDGTVEGVAGIENYEDMPKISPMEFEKQEMMQKAAAQYEEYIELKKHFEQQQNMDSLRSSRENGQNIRYAAPGTYVPARYQDMSFTTYYEDVEFMWGRELPPELDGEDYPGQYKYVNEYDVYDFAQQNETVMTQVKDLVFGYEDVEKSFDAYEEISFNPAQTVTNITLKEAEMREEYAVQSKNTEDNIHMGLNIVRNGQLNRLGQNSLVSLRSDISDKPLLPSFDRATLGQNYDQTVGGEGSVTLEKQIAADVAKQVTHPEYFKFAIGDQSLTSKWGRGRIEKFMSRPESYADVMSMAGPVVDTKAASGLYAARASKDKRLWNTDPLKKDFIRAAVMDQYTILMTTGKLDRSKYKSNAMYKELSMFGERSFLNELVDELYSVYGK